MADAVDEVSAIGKQAIEAMHGLMPLIETIGPTLASAVNLYTKAGVHAAAGQLTPLERGDAARNALATLQAIVTLHAAAVAAFSLFADAVDRVDAQARALNTANKTEPTIH
jgi:hypothetical protein